MAEYRHIEVKQVGLVTVVHFCREKLVEDVGIEELGQELLQLVETDDRKEIVVNLSAAKFLSSAALHKLITLSKRVKKKGGSLKLCNLPAQIHEVFRIAGLDQIFDIREDEAGALAAFSNS